LARHIDEHLTRTRVVDLVHVEHGHQVRGLGRRLTGLDAGKGRGSQIKFLGDFLEFERVSFAKAAELGTEPAPTKGRAKRNRNPPPPFASSRPRGWTIRMTGAASLAPERKQRTPHRL